MKLSHLMLAAGLCSFSAASAQTTPTQAPQRSAKTLTPSSAAPAIGSSNSTAATSNLPAAGLPDAVDNKMPTTRAEKHKQENGTSHTSKNKVKTKM